MPFAYTPAAGRDESCIELIDGIPTIQTAFNGLSGCKFRIYTMSATGSDISDHTVPYPIFVVNRGGEGVVISEPIKRSNQHLMVSMVDFIKRFERKRRGKEEKPACSVCRLERSTQVPSYVQYAGDINDGVEVICDVAVAVFYLYCKKPACFVAVKNLLDAHLAPISYDSQNFMYTRACGNSACTNFGNMTDRALLNCSGCLSEKYCSRECQLICWSEHKLRCRGINAARKAAKAEAKQKAAQPMMAEEGTAATVDRSEA